MNVLFLGSLVPIEYEMMVPKLSVAANQFQNNLIAVLKKENNVKTLSFLAVSAENYEDELYKTAQKYDINVTFAANKKINAVMKYRKLLIKYIEWADCIITYNVLYAWFGIGSMARKRNIKSILVFADFTPPEEEKSFIRKLYAKIVKMEFKKYKKIVLLSEQSKKYLKPKQECVNVNGCIEWNNFKDINEPVFEKTINIVYTGALTNVTGVDLLLRGFIKNKDPQFRLIICGQGHELEELIKKVQEKDKRVIFKGYVERKEYLEILNKGHILVNPRNMDFLQNQNNFPSKILEYLASGRSIVSTKFPGYEKYAEYINFVESTPDEIIKGIEVTASDIETAAAGIYLRNRKFAKLQTWENNVAMFL